MKRAVAYLLTGFLLAGFGVRAEDYVLPVGQTVDALTVDCAAGTGEIVGAKLAAAGTLTLENVPTHSAGAVLPLTLPETLDRGNLATWTVVSGGKALSLRAVVSADGTVRLVSVGTVLILR